MSVHTMEMLRIDRTAPTLRSRVQDTIQGAILDGKLAPGQKIVERELCEATGVSRTIVREALARLEEKGLVGRDANNNLIVVLMSAREIRDIYEVRASLEALAARLFTQRASSDTINDIAGAAERLKNAFRAGELAAIREATTTFYDIMIEGSGNGEIQRSLNAIIERVYFLRTQSMSDPERHDASHSEMQAIASALIARDTAAAEKASFVHVAAACDAALRHLKKAPQGSTPQGDQLK